MTASRRNKLILMAVLLLTPVLLAVEEHVRGRWVLSRLKRQLQAAGEQLSIDACRPPHSDGVNGYGDFMQAASLLPGRRLYDTAPPTLRMISPGRVQGVLGLSNWVASARRPVLRRTGTNTTVSFERGPSRSEHATNNTWEILEASLAAHRATTDNLKAALRQPVLDPRTHYESSFNAWPDFLMPARTAGQHLGVEALVALRRGRLDEALEDLELQLRLCQALRDERLAFPQLVRASIALGAVGPTWQALQAPGWTEAQLARLQQAWQTNEFLLPVIRALEMERAVAVTTFALARRSIAQVATMSPILAELNSVGTSTSTNTVLGAEAFGEAVSQQAAAVAVKGVFLPFWQFAWSRQDEVHYLQVSQQILETARLSAQQGSIQPSMRLAKALESKEEEDGSIARNVRYLLSVQATSTLSAPVTRAATAEAQRNLVVAAIALHRYHLRHGRPAPALSALVPEFLEAVPRDLFDGQPLRYRLGERGAWQLYSVHTNYTDDQGDAGPLDPTARYFSFTSGRDLVWPMPASQDEVDAVDGPR